jgi:hypothetical protein
MIPGRTDRSILKIIEGQLLFQTEIPARAYFRLIQA